MPGNQRKSTNRLQIGMEIVSKSTWKFKKLIKPPEKTGTKAIASGRIELVKLRRQTNLTSPFTRRPVHEQTQKQCKLSGNSPRLKPIRTPTIRIRGRKIAHMGYFLLTERCPLAEKSVDPRQTHHWAIRRQPDRLETRNDSNNPQKCEETVNSRKISVRCDVE